MYPRPRTRHNTDQPILCAQIHTYISTHGTTRRGKEQKHKDDADADGRAGPARKCPKILNDWTQAQPHIDKANRWKQRILAIEERFSTHSFPFRLTTTVIPGFSIVSAWNLFKYHVNNDMYETFSEFVEAVAFDGMANTWDRDHARVPHPQPDPQPARSNHAATSPGNTLEHLLVPISQVPGFVGSCSQREKSCSFPNSASFFPI